MYNRCSSITQCCTDVFNMYTHNTPPPKYTDVTVLNPDSLSRLVSSLTKHAAILP